ncbi:phosphate propanoyltransferase [Carboxydothermus ferrireducens]|uniref:Phosphate propanoyltransferase n=1 Tax=Carboxydothermus ferrireducens DSM 11255 TaxID=1119529 RepID=A0ABX2RBC0_9THEO|nr:phosphate propanoyltransferase [Carboxydothermus ferrireducens]NYE58476.1 putative phosphotransacetylase [Carboxydothermus ferrireducens DSM 11255]
MEKEQLINLITEKVVKQLSNVLENKLTSYTKRKIPLGISNHHVHISETDFKVLFGKEAKMTKLRDLSQPGQFVSEQMVTLVGPKGVIEKVRILGPFRKRTQVEISVSDCFKLGIQAPIRDSGDLAGSASITLVGTVGSITLPEGCIIAARHIHMSPEDANYFGVIDGERVNVRGIGNRGVVFLDVLVRVSPNYILEMHLDVDEANAAALKNGDLMEII